MYPYLLWRDYNLKNISLNKKSVEEYSYTIKLAHNNCKISDKLQNQQLKNFTLNQKGEDMQSVAKHFAYLQQNHTNGVVYAS